VRPVYWTTLLVGAAVSVLGAALVSFAVLPAFVGAYTATMITVVPVWFFFFLVGGLLSALVATRVAIAVAIDYGTRSRRPALLGATAGVGAALLPGLALFGFVAGGFGLMAVGVVSIVGCAAYYIALRRGL
jgi:hypothetical protein